MHPAISPPPGRPSRESGTLVIIASSSDSAPDGFPACAPGSMIMEPLTWSRPRTTASRTGTPHSVTRSSGWPCRNPVPREPRRSRIFVHVGLRGRPGRNARPDRQCRYGPPPHPGSGWPCRRHQLCSDLTTLARAASQPPDTVIEMGAAWHRRRLPQACVRASSTPATTSGTCCPVPAAALSTSALICTLT
jgi:hypothetical protein